LPEGGVFLPKPYTFDTIAATLRELVWRWAALLVKLCDNAKAKKWLTGFVYN